MFGVRADVDGVLFGLAARIPAHAMAGPGLFTKLRLVIQGLLPPLAIARSYRGMRSSCKSSGLGAIGTPAWLFWSDLHHYTGLATKECVLR
jgi:hypothetical protein